ncbi:uroporphyrinogen-III C-methyltransferase [Thalassotalea euphylliae]|uniref:uroporphyrinogen-III C-methyltransferase n=1 Tax=Thalassotalea euphylliae TaxID=1655234 RepID=UPI00363DA735
MLSVLSFKRIKSNGLEAKQREQLWSGSFLNRLFKPKKPLQDENKRGEVVFVGAGAGDIELLTLKAVKALQQADVVLIDWLVNPEINTLIPAHVERIFVGKKCGKHSMKQPDINALLLAEAQKNKRVVRLKGGDPSIFARLAEETATLQKNNVPFQIVPGITAASGCAAYSGIPLTHRDCAQSVKFVTAHLKDENEQCNWQQLAKEQGTVVFYMGLSRVALIAEKLTQNGMEPSMPMAVIDQGTSTEQKVVCSTLGTIEPSSMLNDFVGPALIIVGDVVNYRENVDLTLIEGKQYAAS